MRILKPAVSAATLPQATPSERLRQETKKESRIRAGSDTRKMMQGQITHCRKFEQTAQSKLPKATICFNLFVVLAFSIFLFFFDFKLRFPAS